MAQKSPTRATRSAKPVGSKRQPASKKPSEEQTVEEVTTETTQEAPLPELEQHHIDIPDEVQSTNDDGKTPDEDEDEGDDDHDDTPEDDEDGPQSDEEDQGGDQDPQTPESPAEGQQDPSPDASPGITSMSPVQEPSVTPPVEPEESEEDDEDEEVIEEPVSTLEHHNAGVPNGRIIPVGGEINFEAHEYKNQIVVDEDVYQEVRARGSNRATYRLIYRQGTQIPIYRLRKKD